MILYFGVVLLSIGTKSAFSQDYCKSLVQCTQDADNARSECDKLIKIAYPQDSNSSANATKAKSVKSKDAGSDCGSNVKSISEQLVKKQLEQRQQQRDCLNALLADAVPVGDKGRQEQCQKASDNIGKSGGKRLKRKVTGTPSNATVASNSTGPPHSSSGPTTVPSVSPPSHNETVDSGKDSKKNTTTTNTDYALYAKCVQNAETKAKSCRSLNACCSEVPTCDFEYQLSPLHDEILQLQYDLFKQYRTCLKERTKQAETEKPK